MGKWLQGAQEVRSAMDMAGAKLDDASALEAMALYPLWGSGKGICCGCAHPVWGFPVPRGAGAYIASQLDAGSNAGAFCEGEPRGMAGMGAAHGRA